MFLSTGDMELFGRLDNQVKLRGFRIELGEIDAALLRHFSIKEAITMIVDSNNNKLLVACIFYIFYIVVGIIISIIPFDFM